MIPTVLCFYTQSAPCPTRTVPEQSQRETRQGQQPRRSPPRRLQASQCLRACSQRRRQSMWRQSPFGNPARRVAKQRTRRRTIQAHSPTTDRVDSVASMFSRYSCVSRRANPARAARRRHGTCGLPVADPPWSLRLVPRRIRSRERNGRRRRRGRASLPGNRPRSPGT